MIKLYYDNQFGISCKEMEKSDNFQLKRNRLPLFIGSRFHICVFQG